MNRFSLSSHGTMFVYPLQARLYETIYSAAKDSLRDKKSCLLMEEWLMCQSLEHGYQIGGIKSEIARCCYAAILNQVQWGDVVLYRPTQWGLSLIENIFNEASWQTKQIIIKLARRGFDNYYFAIRDTSFLSNNIRGYLSQRGFRSQPTYELRRTGMRLGDVIETVNGLLAELDDDLPMHTTPKREFDNKIDTVLTLIDSYGNRYPSISDRYVRYNIPNQHTWYVSPTFHLLCASIREMAKGPLEWKGRTFTMDDLYTEMCSYMTNLPDISKLNRWFGYLLIKNFLRRVNPVGLVTLTGQGAVWLKTYFRTMEDNFSQLDLTIRHLNHRVYWLRMANATYLPETLKALLRTANVQETPDWFYQYEATQDQVLYLLELVASNLTVWRRRRSNRTP